MAAESVFHGLQFQVDLTQMDFDGPPCGGGCHNTSFPVNTFMGWRDARGCRNHG